MPDLLGLPLAAALERLESAGAQAPAIVRTEPPRPRFAFPPVERWRVVRVRDGELVVAPPIEAGAGGQAC